jgi:hypothetical protein
MIPSFITFCYVDNNKVLRTLSRVNITICFKDENFSAAYRQYQVRATVLWGRLKLSGYGMALNFAGAFNDSECLSVPEIFFNHGITAVSISTEDIHSP